MKKITFRQLWHHTPKDAEVQPKVQPTSSQSAYLRRREQVRRAQRTHRDRKEAYIKELEREVLRLRANEANILQKNENLVAEVGKLHTTLAEHGILRSDLDSSVTAQASDTLDGYSGKPQIYVQKENAGDIFYLSSKGGALVARKSEPTDFNDVTSTSRAPIVVDDITLTNIGTEFVLTLESPCLSHHTPSNPNHPTCHALTATAPLLFYSQVSEPLQERSTWNVPTASLQRLLELSSSLALEDEVTPVQAWNYIRRHSRFNAIDLELLTQLASKLLKHIKCHGFGGVIKQEAFKESVFEFLGEDPILIKQTRPSHSY
ncbi:hypothetical protein V1509DRAFT_670522 [Lipomyces kononenkoae]